MLLALLLTASAEPELLQQSAGSSCILNAIRELKPSCSSLTDSAKQTIALILTNCVLEGAGRQPILCQRQPHKLCLSKTNQFQWTTYSGYVTHIDNLCQYYHQLDWEARAFQAVQKVGVQSLRTLNLVRETLDSTKKVQHSHKSLQHQIYESIRKQREQALGWAEHNSRVKQSHYQLQQKLDQFADKFSKHTSDVSRLLGKFTSAAAIIQSSWLFDLGFASLATNYSLLLAVLFLLSAFSGCQKSTALGPTLLCLVSEISLSTYQHFGLALMVRMGSWMTLARVLLMYCCQGGRGLVEQVREARNELRTNLRSSRLVRLIRRASDKAE